MADDRRGRRFVVLGFPRSGTTLLRRLLDAHPQVSCPPETGLVSACGRFLESVPTVDGLSVGVLSGLAYSRISRDEVFDSLRALVFGFHERIAGDKPVWVEKTAFDIFHLEEVEELLVGHCRFLCVVRNPFDVIASVKDLFEGMDRILPEMLPYVHRNSSLFDAYAEAWVDRMTALNAFIERRPDDCFTFRYEDLVADPLPKLRAITDYLGVAAAEQDLLDSAFGAPAKVGLGDWNTYATAGVSQASVESWRSRLPASTVARLTPRLAPLMEAHGYPPPKVPRIPEGDAAMRKYELTMQLTQRNANKG